MSLKLAFVFVTCRKDIILTCIESYVKNAKQYKHKFDIFLIEDTAAEKNIVLEKKIKKLDFNLFYYTHKDIERDLKEKSYIFPKRSGACRGYAFLKVYLKKYDYMFTVDDDVFALSKYDFIGMHLDAMQLKGNGKWYNPFDNLLIKEDIYSRGFPYNSRKVTQVILNQGTQLVGMDVDSITLKNLKANDGIIKVTAQYLFNRKYIIIPKDIYTTIAYTSVCIKHMAIPAYYTQLMREKIDGIEINRFDDIFSGLFLKKIADHLKYTVSHGLPITEHRKIARNLQNDLLSEKRGIDLMDYLWQAVDKIKLTKNSFLSCYRELAEQLECGAKFLIYSDFIVKNSKAMKLWCDLLEEK